MESEINRKEPSTIQIHVHAPFTFIYALGLASLLIFMLHATHLADALIKNTPAKEAPPTPTLEHHDYQEL